MPSRLLAPYGSWTSPISASQVAAAGTPRGTLEELHLADGTAYWSQIRPDQGGRSSLTHWTPSTGAQELLPLAFSVRTRVHEYGGGAIAVGRRFLCFVNAVDQRIYRLDPGRSPRPITPEPEVSGSIRYADAEVSPDGRRLIAVRERHGSDGVINDLVLLDSQGDARPQAVAAGHDFFAFPRFHPEGRAVCWTTWDLPEMPWQGSQLWMAGVGADGSLSPPRRVAGGSGESIFQPSWSPDGRLHFVSDRRGWWNLYSSEPDGSTRALLPMEADIGLPQWGLGFSRYVFLSADVIACVLTRSGMDEIGLLAARDGRFDRIATGLTCCYPPQLRWDGRSLWLLAGSAQLPQSVVRYDLTRRERQIVYTPIKVDLEDRDLSVPEHISFESADGRTAHAFYYPPRSARCRAPAREAPPLLVASHGGPTSAAHSFLSLWIQYWTSRGIAVVDVNYGGSSGYGRAYRDSLRGRWGIVDVEDCVQAAVALANQGRADGHRLMIRGGSAGGFTTLSALAFFRVFAAAASYYGVADIERIARDTHKFEAGYFDWLVGPYPEQKTLYAQRSPIHHLDRFVTPVILFQGEDDQVVPLAQSASLASALEARRVPHVLLTFRGEGHGFRKAENIRRCYQAELTFYAKVLGFRLAERLPPLQVPHLAAG